MTSDPLVERMRPFGTTIFTEMSALATRTGSINLGQGFPDTDGPAEMLAAAARALQEGANQYPPLPGIPALREAIAEHEQRFWALPRDPGCEVVVTAGATEAVAAAILSLCEPGDEVVTFEPYYDSYAASITLAGAVRRPVTLRPVASGRYGFDEAELRAAFGPRTRLVLLNSPHNPTGKVFTRSELGLIADLCRQHDTYAVTDEVYEHLVFTDAAEPHVPLAGLPGMRERTLRISSAGKTFSCTGWKVGWATGPERLVSALTRVKQFLTFVNAGPLQPAVAVALGLGDDYFTGFRDELQARRDHLTAGLAEAGFAVQPSDGTYFVTADIRPLGGTDGIEFCRELPERCGVVAVPTQVFYDDRAAGRHLIRFAFCKRESVIDEAAQRLAKLGRG
ncbi:pyridoxal phosphate-dependent aminotransferase [Paractinoplanes hotanensis]|uniref:Pyridoxal phosphate-dependent aminotransferase n=1 Tax=Paractinoplanes hotanensis TaxID=2906497 RepID=A0ABT0Y1T5_9ACTN|nr:pyridoxal phosphate-dependent aminotransferase [Actinoplanes hotanensis]MCM4079835.1 pyridoxal phosphate-dependent aminotransferase [Actinoplanes hotanensis]